MELLLLAWRQYRQPFISVMALSLASAALGIGPIAFINQRLIETIDTTPMVLPEFLGLLLLSMAVTLGSQLALITLGHHFVYRLHSGFIKRILDTHAERIGQLGSASLLAGLTSDIRSIIIAFVRLPELVQGIILIIGSAAYLTVLSTKMLLITAVWMTITIWGGLVLMTRVYKYMATLRETEGKLYNDYQTVLEGHEELALNRKRAGHTFDQIYVPDAKGYRHHIIRADTFHLDVVDWSNIMMLGAIGLVFWMANNLGWADTAVAATYSPTLLFLRTPSLSAVDALPTLPTAQMAFNKLNKFALAPFRAEFPRPTAFLNWQMLELRNVVLHYQDNAFSVGPVNLMIRRGEPIFLIDGNGSGKSTLAVSLTGLYRPRSGGISLDDEAVAVKRPENYRKLFSAALTDVWLFGKLLGPGGKEVSPQLVARWLEHLKMGHKLELSDDRILNLELLKGQKKRMAPLLALVGERGIILLGEWAADQGPHFRREFYQVLLPLMQEMGKTTFAVSHDDHYSIRADRLLEMCSEQLSELSGDERDATSRDAVAHTT